MRTLALVLLGLFLAVDVEAACTGSSPTWTSTPDQVSVASCVSSATRGDTINVSAGSATWSSLSTITKGVTLQGVGTPTITAANGSNFILQYTPATPSNDDLFRVTGFVFNMNSAGSILHLSLSTTVEQHNIRVDNNTFQNGVFGVKPLLVEGPFYGVVDHNTFTGSAYIENYGSSAGSNNWTNLTFDPGSA